MLFNKILHYKLKNRSLTDSSVRREIGEFTGWVGIILNLFMAISKIFIGFLISSIAVMADGVNNSFDTASSLATIIGYRLASKPADSKHPYGHGRIEYITGVLISLFVIIIGLQFIKSSYERIINPTLVLFDKVSLGILLFSILLKLWFSRFNKFVGEKINSKTLLATAYDSMGDVVTTIVVIIPMLSGLFTTFQIDGYIGILVSLMIIYNGGKLLKETINPLIGNPPEPELVEKIKACIYQYEDVKNIHNIRYETYGGADALMTLDAEMPGHFTLDYVHKIADKIEVEILKQYGINIVIHMEPAEHHNEVEKAVLAHLRQNICDCDWIINFHDFRIEKDKHDEEGFIEVIVDGYKVEDDRHAENFLREKLTQTKAIKWNIRMCKHF